MKKQPALFLPGLDGDGGYAMSSLKNLSIAYDLHRLHISPVRY